ncbi:MAG: hypothetical protein I3J02_10460 [Prevotella sp.]|nr:hypothetical protein [Prevotella sp.]
MEQDSRFIAFDLDGMNHVDQLVNELLTLSVSYMNGEALLESPHHYRTMSGADVEKLSYESMKSVAPQVGFDVDRIDLISGHVFPDIILHNTRYGVEVKSTQKDAWTSTGSSIVESTRDINTDRVYMLFGKLGGIPEFRCKPYQQCLSNIAVTHSPRYLIDMNLSEEDNIFSKMNTKYDDFRQFEENMKISKVREYYLQKAKAEHKYEMPWWMGESTSVNLSFYNDLSKIEKSIIQARACILFRSLYQKDSHNRYRPISLWLCNSYSLLCPNMRDDFSAGGKCTVINGKKLEKPYPHIVRELLLSHQQIKTLLINPDEDILRGIHDFWDFDYDENNLYASWLEMIVECFKNNPELSFIPIRELLESNAVPS